MGPARALAARLAHAASLLLGVTFLSFLLLVEFGPDPVYNLIDRNASQAQIDALQSELGTDRPMPVRYLAFLGDLVRGELGAALNGRPVGELLASSLPVTLMLVLPGFLLGNLAGIGLGMAAAWHRGRWLDRLVSTGSVLGMSLSFLVIIIGLQVLLCTPWGLNWFPARGWDVTGPVSYLQYAFVPGLALVLITLGYNTRFYRAVMVEELDRDHIRTVRAYGGGPRDILFRHVLRNSLGQVLTRVLYSIPLVVVSGSLLLETYFGIPGVGRVTFDAIENGDSTVLLAVVALTAVAFVLVQAVTDALLRLADPRIESA